MSSIKKHLSFLCLGISLLLSIPALPAHAQRQVNPNANPQAQANTSTPTSVGGVIRTKPEGYSGPLPDCSFTNEGCRNINSLLELTVNIATFLLGIIGSVALVFFIYGGVTIILSFGTSDKVKKGKDILVASVVGLAISFSAFMLIQFLLDSIGISDDYNFSKFLSSETQIEETYV